MGHCVFSVWCYRNTKHHSIIQPRQENKLMQRNYKVVCNNITLVGEASSPQNACRKAFKTLLREKKIKRQPAFDPDSPSTFENTTVEVHNEG